MLKSRPQTNPGPQALGHTGSPQAERLEPRLVFANVVVTTVADAGPGSLREALATVNASSGDDVIQFNLPAGPQTISLQTPLPQVAAGGGALTVNGPGANLLTIGRSPNNPTNFGILDSLSPSLTLTGLTLTGGVSATLGGGLAIGSGGLKATLDGVVIADNSANSGGGIGVGQGSFLTLRNSTVSGNICGSAGGGIYFYTDGSLFVENSTVSGNGAGNVGGGIYFFGTPAVEAPAGFTSKTLVVRNSTIANNRARAGGGIELRTFGGTLLLQNSTVSGNKATGGGLGGDDGGGVQLRNGTGTMTVTSSVVSGNTGAYAQDLDSVNQVTVTYSAIGIEDGVPLTPASGNNLPYNTPLLLGPLDDNGGPTLTFLPQPGSPLIDAGANPAGLTTDQRGPGFARVSGAAADIGAVETPGAVVPPTLSSTAVNGGAPQRSQVKTLSFVFDRAVTLATGALKLEQLNTGGSGTNNGAPPTDASAALNAPTSADGGVTWVYTFSAAATAFVQNAGGSLVDGVYTATLDPAKVTAATGGTPMAAAPAPLTFHRLFGDVNGSKNVNNADYILFRTTFGKPTGDPAYIPAFDFDGGGLVNNADYIQFRNRFGKTLTY